MPTPQRSIPRTPTGSKTNNIEASTKTIYNDILRLQEDFAVPVVYDAKRWGCYITEPEFKPYELQLISCFF